MKSQVCSYGPWEKCIRLANNEIELIVTTEVGPRIIRFGFIGDVNEFVEYPDQPAMRNDGKYHSYGGHRLWAAPETEGWTNHPDNYIVEWKEENDAIIFTAQIEIGTRLQKQMKISVDEKSSHVCIIHRITNYSEKHIRLAPWSISEMAPGGRVILPHEKFTAHSERVLPVRPLVLWGYTEMQDKRWSWGNRFVQLRQDSQMKNPQKIGMLITQGWAAYVNHDHIFIKHFPFQPEQIYPDFGCNAEVFTNYRMLEVESLGPLITIESRQSVAHQEDWYLFRGIQLGESEEEFSRALDPLLQALHTKDK